MLKPLQKVGLAVALAGAALAAVAYLTWGGGLRVLAGTVVTLEIGRLLPRPAVGAAHVRNLVPNPSFEQTIGDVPSAWRIGWVPPGPGCRAGVANDRARGGRSAWIAGQCLRGDGQFTGIWWYSETYVRVSPQARYELSGWIYVEGPRTRLDGQVGGGAIAALGLVAKDKDPDAAEGGHLRFGVWIPLSGTGWTYVDAVVPAGSDVLATGAVQVALYYKGADSNRVYYDDVGLTALD